MKLIIAIIIACMLVSVIFSQSKNKVVVTDTKDEQELRGLIKIWNEAESRGDHAIIANLLADDFSFLGGPDKSQYLGLAGANDGILLIDSSTLEEVNVQVYRESAIVTTLNSFITKGDRKRFPDDKYLMMTVWLKREGRWRCVRAAKQAVEKDTGTALTRISEPTMQ
jgi:uncharacterized protein (TIGR02246 family)